MDIHLLCIWGPADKFSDSVIFLSHYFECHWSSCLKWIRSYYVGFNSPLLYINIVCGGSHRFENVYTCDLCPCFVVPYVTEQIVLFTFISQDVVYPVCYGFHGSLSAHLFVVWGLPHSSFCFGIFSLAVFSYSYLERHYHFSIIPHLALWTLVSWLISITLPSIPPSVALCVLHLSWGGRRLWLTGLLLPIPSGYLWDM